MSPRPQPPDNLWRPEGQWHRFPWRSTQCEVLADRAYERYGGQPLTFTGADGFVPGVGGWCDLADDPFNLWHVSGPDTARVRWFEYAVFDGQVLPSSPTPWSFELWPALELIGDVECRYRGTSPEHTGPWRIYVSWRENHARYSGARLPFPRAMPRHRYTHHGVSIDAATPSSDFMVCVKSAPATTLPSAAYMMS